MNEQRLQTLVTQGYMEAETARAIEEAIGESAPAIGFDMTTAEGIDAFLAEIPEHAPVKVRASAEAIAARARADLLGIEADREEARKLARALTPESIAAMPVFDAAEYLNSEEHIAAFEAEFQGDQWLAGLSEEERAKALAGAQSVVARARARLAAK
jgi:hypothetical protein